MSTDEVIRVFSTDVEQGLTSSEAALRLTKRGRNELQEKERPGFLALLGGQFNNFLVIVLIVAAVISLALGEWLDAIAILVIVVLNAIVGVVQESKAEQALAALKKMAAPNAQVIRDGQQKTVPASELVPGDVVLIEAGNYVPADLRLIESVNLKVEEASLTGESVPVDKDAGAILDAHAPLGDRKNSAFMSTLITYGRGKGVVASTGMGTQIGLIAEMLQSYEEEQTPLQLKLNQLGRWLGIVCLAICGMIFLYGIIRDTNVASIATKGLMAYLRAEQKDIVQLFMTAVSLAIAAVPEGLPAVVTICLALGMQRMIRRHALIRKLPAVETLGCATIICSDKTGTLTQNEMTVVQGWAGGRLFQVTGEGYVPSGDFFTEGLSFDPAKDPSTSLLLYGSLLCNDARLEQCADNGCATWRIVGDPTEGAMTVAAAKCGLWRNQADKVLPRVMEIPFDSERKRMTTVHELGSECPALPFNCPPVLSVTKGAPDVILNLCNSIAVNGGAIPLTENGRQEVLSANKQMAGQALRVLGVAYRPLVTAPKADDGDGLETALTFVGLLGMIDPARPEAAAAIKVAQRAGLRTLMITGDYKETAVAIAEKIGLRSPNGIVLTGSELDCMSDAELDARIDHVEACCRVSPQHKTRIVEALKAKGHVVAMTGDGVNDAPALKRANIGVAMGITGTDVSKETADMVLTDDNFASIVSAVEEGRVIYSNIRKFVFYLISCNVGEILIIFLAMLFGIPVPLRPVQLLMLNLITDGAPALALGLEKGDPGLMEEPPRSPKEPVINREMQISTAVQASVMTIAVLWVYYLALNRYPGNIETAQTIAFVSLSMSELLRAFTARSQHYSLISIGPFSNRWMVYATAGSAVLILVMMYVPFLRPFFDMTPLSPGDWLLMLPFILSNAVAAEVMKIFLRRHAHARHKELGMASLRGSRA